MFDAINIPSDTLYKNVKLKTLTIIHLVRLK